MSDDKSILLRMKEQGLDAPRVNLKGTERNERAEDRYEIVGELARGGIGAVHRGRDNDLGRDVALKVLLDQHLKTPEMVQRFVEEAQIGGQLQHPGIVPVYELGLRADDRPYFAMKLVKGETLAARLAEGKSTRRDILAVFREVCRTMAYAHARGVIHRDLKPSNVMIGNFGEVQVVDWGFAKVMRKGGVADERLKRKAERDVTMISTVRSDDGSAPSVAGSVMGTPAYMPPEQALGRVEDLDEKSDLFSLGAILCEILTGHPPYTGVDRMTDAGQARLDEAHARLDACDADPKLVALCKRCLQALPKKRPASAEALADEVAAYLTTAEGRAHRAQVRALRAEARATAQKRARHLTTIVGGSAVVALVLAAGAYFWIDAGRTGRERARQAKIESALQDASRLRKARKWPEALAAAQRAIVLGDDGTLAQTIQAEKERADALANREAEDAAFLAELDDIVAQRGDEFSDRQADRAYVAAVERRWPDFDVDTKRMQASRSASALATAFDRWAFMRRFSKHLQGSDWRTIDRIARAIDPESNDFRDALARKDLERLKAFAGAADVAALSAGRCVLIGSVLKETRLYGQAIAFFKRAVRKHPGTYWLHYGLATAAEQRVPRLAPGRARAGFGRANALARQHYVAALALKPQSVEARHRLGIVMERSGDPEGAVEIWRDALKLRPDWAHGLGHIADALARLGKLDDADAAHRSALEMKPRSATVLEKYGAYLNNWRNRPDKAHEYFKKALRIEDNAGTWFNLGVVLSRLGNRRGAIEAFENALRLDSESPYALDALASLVAPHERARAIGLRERAAALAPNEPRILVNLGVSLVFDGQVDAGIEQYLRAIDQDPDYAHAWSNLAAAYDRKPDHERAIEASRRVVELEPDNPGYRYGHGTRLQNAGFHAKAVSHLERAVDLVPGNAEAWCNLGKSYEALGRWADAVKARRHGHELGTARANWTYPSGKWLAEAERMLALAPKYETVVKAAEVEASPQERATLGWMLLRTSHYARATELFRDAFRGDPALVDLYLWPAFRAAARAGDPWRAQALEWGRALLEQIRESLVVNPASVVHDLWQWETHRDLAPVRDAADLPQEWKALWAEARALYRQAGGT